MSRPIMKGVSFKESTMDAIISGIRSYLEMMGSLRGRKLIEAFVAFSGGAPINRLIVNINAKKGVFSISVPRMNGYIHYIISLLKKIKNR
jgi:hypothetical protein